MSFLSAIPIVGKVLDGVFGLVDQVVEDKDEKNKLKAQLEHVFRNADLTKFTSQLQAQRDVIVAEAMGKSFLQRNWRPGIMCLFGVIIANNYIIHPYISVLFGVNIMMPIPPEMWSLLKLGISGYIIGRSTEKGLKIWKEKEKK